MSIDSSIGRNDYIGVGNVNEYDYTFKIFDEGHLKVIVKDTADVETVLVINTDYTVDGVGRRTGGTVTLTVDLETDYTLTILRNIDIKQVTDFKNQGTFYGSVHEDTFDRQTMVSQQQQEQISRSIKISESTLIGDFDPTLPTPLEIGHTIIINETGTGLELGPSVDDLAQASIDAAAAAASAIAANASAVAAALSESAASDSEVAAAASESAASASAIAAAASAVAADASATIAETYALLDGVGAPATPLGVNGSKYIDTSTGDFYEKSGGTWSLIFSAVGGVATRAGQSVISSGVQTKSVTFSGDMSDTSYSIKFSLENVTDSDPQFLTAMVTAKSISGFTVKFNAPTDSANYVLSWSVTESV